MQAEGADLAMNQIQTDVAHLLLLKTGDKFVQIGMEQVLYLVTSAAANIVIIKRKF